MRPDVSTGPVRSRGDEPSLSSIGPCALATAGPPTSARSGVTKRTPPLSERASPSEATETSNRPPARRKGETSAVTITAATFRGCSTSAGTSTWKRRSRLAIESTVWPIPRPAMARSPVPSRPTTRP